MTEDPTLRAIWASAVMHDLSPRERERLIILAGDKVKDERLYFETVTAINRR